MENKKLAFVLLLGLLLLPVMALAQDNPTGVDIADLPALIGKIEGVIWTIFGLIAVICFVVAGILFLTAGGAPDKVASARAAFIYGVVGVVVGIIAYSIVAIVATFLST